jgi:hypothetical protein
VILNAVFDFFSNYLIEFMGSMLVVGLFFRWFSWRSSKREDAYFSSFTSEVEKIILLQKDNTYEQIDDVDKYIDDLLSKVEEKLPSRNLRSKGHNKKSPEAEKRGAQNVVSLRDYVKGDQSLFLGIKNESTCFKSKFPPNFNELSDRILEKDDSWNKLLGFFPIGPISRLIDILPGLFVVFGIFGTFIGISMALPKIAAMDFNNLEASGEILTSFVLSVTYAMKTSIAGILFSVVMTLLNTIAPVKGIRNRTYKKISNCFENIWYSIHAEKSAEEEMREVLPALLAEVKLLRKAAFKEDHEKETEEEQVLEEGA